MIFIESIGFACNNINTDVCVTSGAVLLTDWVDLDTPFVVQLREIARVLGSQGSPAEPDIGSGGTQSEFYPRNSESFR